MMAPRESVYTLAANAALKLILDNDIDPQNVGMLALGTESSTDNSAGAVQVRGLLDEALRQLGKAPLSVHCEVPEVKHACLGGIYALKNAARFVATDGLGQQAIVVSVDIAEYALGSSGEQTQGAGAVAMLVESEPKLLALELSHCGSASAYRGADFRKPIRRFFMDAYPSQGRLHDFPVFNGRYSTFCYLDQTRRAFAQMVSKLGQGAGEVLEESAAVLFHRPYHYMPIQGMAAIYVQALLSSDEGRAELESLASSAGVTVEAVMAELEAPSWSMVPQDQAEASVDPCPALSAVAKLARRSEAFGTLVGRKMSLGSELMKQCGNMYTAALPAWLAAALYDALGQGLALEGQRVVALGYGSGDAAEALPMRVVPGWQEAAARIGFEAALEGAVDLEQSQYEALHGGQQVEGFEGLPARGFFVRRIGQENQPRFQDIGLEYWGFEAFEQRS